MFASAYSKQRSTRDAFKSIESIVFAFSSVAQMLEATYEAMFSSFRFVTWFIVGIFMLVCRLLMSSSPSFVCMSSHGPTVRSSVLLISSGDSSSKCSPS